MKIVRILVVSISIAAIAGVFGYRELRGYLARSLNENYLRHEVAEFVRSNFDRAVIVDAVRLERNGVLTIYNMRISSENDFNDNDVLLSAPKIELRLNIFPLLQKKISIKKIVVSDADFSVLKRHTGDYKSAFYFFTAIHRAFSQSGSSKALIVLDNCNFHYNEQFQTATQRISFEHISGDALFHSDRIKYSLQAAVEESAGSQLSAEGEILYSQPEESFLALSLRAKINAIPLAPLNAYLENSGKSDLNVGGSCSGEILFHTLRDSHSCTLHANLSRFSLARRTLESDKELLREADYSLDAVFDILFAGKRAILRELKLSGDGIRADVDGLIADSGQKNALSLINAKGEIDLKLLSPALPLSAGAECSGKVSLSSSIAASAGTAVHYFYTNIHSDNLTYNQSATDNSPSHALSGSVSADLNTRRIDIDAKMRKDLSAAALLVNSRVIRWTPFSTLTSAAITSESFSAGDFYSAGAFAYRWFTDEAIKDAKTGYDDIFFKDKPYGRLINNNDITLLLNFDSLTLGEKAETGPLKVRFVLEEGELTTPDFSFSGFSGEYTFFLRGSFNTDYARVTSRASMSGFDLAQWYAATGAEGNVSGTLSSSMEFDENGYGLKHFVLSNICHFSLTGESIRFENTPLNKRLDPIINGDARRADLSSVTLNSARFRIMQSALSYQVSDFGASGTPFSFASNGTYDYGVPLEIPFTISTSGGLLKGYFGGSPKNLTVNFPDGRSYSLYRDYLTAPEKI